MGGRGKAERQRAGWSGCKCSEERTQKERKKIRERIRERARGGRAGNGQGQVQERLGHTRAAGAGGEAGQTPGEATSGPGSQRAAAGPPPRPAPPPPAYQRAAAAGPYCRCAGATESAAAARWPARQPGGWRGRHGGAGAWGAALPSHAGRCPPPGLGDCAGHLQLHQAAAFEHHLYFTAQ